MILDIRKRNNLVLLILIGLYLLVPYSSSRVLASPVADSLETFYPGGFWVECSGGAVPSTGSQYAGQWDGNFGDLSNDADIRPEEYVYVYTFGTTQPQADWVGAGTALLPQTYPRWYRVSHPTSRDTTAVRVGPEPAVFDAWICYPEAVPATPATVPVTATRPTLAATLTSQPTLTGTPTATPQGTINPTIATPVGGRCYLINSLDLPNTMGGFSIANFQNPPWPSVTSRPPFVAPFGMFVLDLATRYNVWARMVSNSLGYVPDVAYATFDEWDSGFWDGDTRHFFHYTGGLSPSSYMLIPSTAYAFFIEAPGGAPFTVEVCINADLTTINPQPSISPTGDPARVTPDWSGFPTSRPIPQPDNCQGNGGPASSSCLQRTEIALQRTVVAIMNRTPLATWTPQATQLPYPTQDVSWQQTSVALQKTGVVVYFPTNEPGEGTPTMNVPGEYDRIGTAVEELCQKEPCAAVRGLATSVAGLTSAIDQPSEPGTCVTFPTTLGDYGTSTALSEGFCAIYNAAPTIWELVRLGLKALIGFFVLRSLYARWAQLSLGG